VSTVGLVKSRLPQPFRSRVKGRSCPKQRDARGQRAHAQAQVATVVKQQKEVAAEKYLLHGNQGSRVRHNDAKLFRLFFQGKKLICSYPQAMMHSANMCFTGVNNS